jgi:hypothetical protein
MATQLTVERCAEIRAEMEAGRLLDDVLGRAGIGADEWTAAQRTWLDKMGDELKRGRFELTNRYTQAFLERQRELSALDRAAIVEASAPVEEALPPPPPAVLPPPEIAPPPAVPAAPSPWAAPPPAPVVSAAAAPQIEERSPWAGEETGAPAASPLRAPLPFQPAPAGAAPPPSVRQVPPPPPSSPELGGTVVGAIISPFAAGGALPFARDAAAPPAATAPAAPPPPRPPPPRPVPPPPPSRPAASAPEPDGMEGTVMGAISPFASGAPLPFVKAPPKPASPPAAAPSPPVAAPSPAVAAASPPAGLTLEQYASLCAELAFSPAQADATLGRYRVSAAGKAELDQYWGARLAADPALNTKWREAYQIYFGFLTSARRR